MDNNSFKILHMYKNFLKIVYFEWSILFRAG